MKILYTFGVNLYTFGVRIAALWNPKAKKWIKGREDVWAQVNGFKKDKNVYWFHCASLGEFEQGRPIMEVLKANQQCQIVVSFFSPSGYEIRKDYEGADLVVYLPKDSKRNAENFLKAIEPDAVFFIKYEFWANYVFTCREMNIPIYSIAALFRRDQIFFSSYGKFMRKVLKGFNKIFVQNESSKNLLAEIHIDSSVCGDTRFDRVMKNAENVERYEVVEQFLKGGKALICGSIWSEDLNTIYGAIASHPELKVIIAPHEISEQFIQQIESKVQKSVRYSKLLESGSGEEVTAIIIDNIGMLMNLYQYGSVSYIGGGFKTGLHNILEPAAFGLPVIFGNRHHKFPEAQMFIDEGIGFEVDSSQSFKNTLDQLLTVDKSSEVLAFMKKQMGATELILKELTKEQS